MLGSALNEQDRRGWPLFLLGRHGRRGLGGGMPCRPRLICDCDGEKVKENFLIFDLVQIVLWQAEVVYLKVRDKIFRLPPKVLDTY